MTYVTWDAVDATTFVGFVLAWIIRFPPDATRHHSVMFTSVCLLVEQHWVLAFVQMVLPVNLLGGLATVVVLSTLFRVSFLVGPGTWTDQATASYVRAFVVDGVFRYTTFAVNVENTSGWAVKVDESSSRTQGELAAVVRMCSEVSGGLLDTARVHVCHRELLCWSCRRWFDKYVVVIYIVIVIIFAIGIHVVVVKVTNARWKNDCIFSWVGGRLVDLISSVWLSQHVE